LYRSLQAEFQSLQNRFEEKCRRLREYEEQHPQHSQQERVKQEHVEDDATEPYQPLQLLADRRQRDGATNTNVKVEAGADSVGMSDKEAGDGEPVTREEGSDDESSDSDEDDDGSDSEEEDSDSDGRPSKRYVDSYVILCHSLFWYIS
jgi:hypothetical protein